MRRMKVNVGAGRSGAWEERLEAEFEALREECGAPPEAPGFLAGFRARRDAWIDRGAQAAAWRLLALRLAPAGALAAVVLVAMAPGFDTSGTDPAAVAEDPPVTEYPDPFAAGLAEAGVATLALSDDAAAAYELVAALYEPLETP